MNEHDESEFEDPGFRSAVRRAVGRQPAPASLRVKVISLLAAEAAAGAGGNGAARAEPAHAEPTPAGSPPRPGRGLSIGRDTWRTLAAAACVILAVGWMGLRIRSEFFPPRPLADAGTPGSITAIPASLVLEVVRTHDNCAKLPDHHKIPGDDPEKLRERLTAEAGVTASAVSLGADWKFRGAGICKVGQKQAAHLQFVRADEYISIFSMTATDECGYGADAYSDVLEKHPVAGFRHRDALYCVVASAGTRDLTKDAIEPVLQKVQGSLASGCLTHEGMMETAAASAHNSPASSAQDH